MKDLSAAIAAAREALAKEAPTAAMDAVRLDGALRDLLSALDAAQPVAWALTMPDGVCLIHATEEASRRAESRWPEAYEGCKHVPFYAAPPAQPLVERYGDGVLVHWPEGVEQYVQVGDCVTGYLAPPTASPRSKT